MHFLKLGRLLSIAFFIHGSLSGQCPDRDLIIKALKDRSSIPASARLKELTGYEARSRNCFSANDTIFYLLYEKIGLAYYDLNHFEKAVYYIQKAIGQQRITYDLRPTNISRLARYYYYLQVFYDSLQQRTFQMEAVDSCLALEKRANGNYFYSAYIIKDKVWWLYNKGDYKQCITYSDFGESLIQKNLSGIDSVEHLLYILTYKAQSLLYLGDSTQAEDLVMNRIKISIDRGANSFLGVMYSLAGQVYSHNQKYANAVISYHKAWAANKKLKYFKGCAENISNISGLLNDNFNNPDSSLWYSRVALKYADAIDSLVIFNNMGNAMVKKRKFDSVFYYYRIALDKLSPGMDIKDMLTIPIDKKVSEKITEYVTNLIINYGNAFLEKFKVYGDELSLDKGIEVFKIADKFLTRVKSEHFEIETKLFWRGYSRKLYAKAIEACYLRKDIEHSLYFFEGSRAVLLNDKLDAERGMPDSVLVHQADLKLRELDLQKQLAALEPGSEAFADLQQKIYSNTILKESLARKVNAYVLGNSFSYVLPDVEAVRKQILRNHQALVEVFVSDSSVYILTILKTGSSLQKINKEIYDDLAQEFISNLSKPLLFQAQFQKFLEGSHKLYNLIFEHIKIPAGRIIISPDGTYFPFEALVSRIAGNQYDYFLQNYAVSYTYSAKYLANNWDQAYSRSGIFMGIAPERYQDHLNLATLTGSENSLKIIGNEFDQPSNYFGSLATRNNFMENFFRYKIIHLYSHASANVGTGEPVLYFVDSALYLKDLILRERPITSLVVLAACESGLGKFYLGEGVFSFNRAFASIGIPAAIVNLWPVDNKTTYELNELFYKHLAEGIDLDVALQQAKLEYLQKATGEKKLPYYWAPSVVTGRSASISVKNNFKYYPWVYITSFLMTMLLGIAVYIGLRQGGEIFDSHVIEKRN